MSKSEVDEKTAIRIEEANAAGVGYDRLSRCMFLLKKTTRMLGHCADALRASGTDAKSAELGAVAQRAVGDCFRIIADLTRLEPAAHDHWEALSGQFTEAELRTGRAADWPLDPDDPEEAARIKEARKSLPGI